MADHGLNVQEIFADEGIAVNIPLFLRKKELECNDAKVQEIVLNEQMM